MSSAAPEKKKTGGGTFDPAARNVYFLASDPKTLMEVVRGGHRNVLTPLNDIMGPRDQERLRHLLLSGCTVLLDSGVFTLIMDHVRQSGGDFYSALAADPRRIPGYDALLATYIVMAREFESRLWGYIEMDAGGAEVKRRVRGELEADGLRPIPVYHPLTDPWDYFDELAAQYDRIAMGNVVQSRPSVRVRILHEVWQRAAAYPGLWIHVLGYTPDQHMIAYPFHSADSSTFLQAVRYGEPSDAAAGRKFKVSQGFNHVLGEKMDAPRGRDASASLAGYAAALQELNWQQMVAARR